MRARFTGNRLVLANGREVALDRLIVEAIESGGAYVVVLDPSGSSQPENAVGLNDQGMVAWRIRRLDLPGPGPYTGVAERSDGVWLIHFSGFVVRIDPASGAVLAQELAK